MGYGSLTAFGMTRTTVQPDCKPPTSGVVSPPQAPTMRNAAPMFRVLDILEHEAKRHRRPLFCLRKSLSSASWVTLPRPHRQAAEVPPLGDCPCSDRLLDGAVRFVGVAAVEAEAAVPQVRAHLREETIDLVGFHIPQAELTTCLACPQHSRRRRAGTSPGDSWCAYPCS